MYFTLFSTCVVVDGMAHSLIYDLDRLCKYDIPKDVSELLALAKKHSLDELAQIYEADQEYLINFFNQFVNSEIGFFTKTPERFPDIDFSFETPYKITNAILEIDHNTNYKFSNLIVELNDLGCRAVQVFIRHSISADFLVYILECFSNSRINQVEIFLPYESPISIEKIFSLAKLEPRLSRIFMYGAPENKLLTSDDIFTDKLVVYQEKDIRIDLSEIFSIDRFTVNIEVFSEAQNHNVGLNRKICVDKEGIIRNYLNHTETFGHVEKNQIADIIEQPAFQKKWYIGNNIIETCKDCQYRFCCVSNSDIEIRDDKFYKTMMCTFDPNTNTWA